MKRILSLSLLALMCLTSWAQSEQLAVTMNTTSRTMQLVPFYGREAVEVGEPTSNKYTFEAAPGRYLLTGYTSAGLRNGTLVVDLQAGQEFKVFTITAKATNAGWELGKDYTVETSLVSNKMERRDYITGVDKQPQTAVTFLATMGDSYTVSLVPSAEHQAEGYLTYTESNPLTANKTISKAIPHGYSMTLTAPKGAEVFVGSKVRHFVPFTPIECIITEESGDNMVYTYTLAEKTDYTYRVSMEGKVTTAGKFNMPSENYSLTISEADMAGDPKQIVRDVTANNGYNVSDLFLNGDHTGCVTMNVGDRHQIVSLRNWEIVDGITNNYFIEPDYHYTVLNEQGQPSTDIVEVSANGEITAKKSGTAIVLVTYDALNAPTQAGGPLFGAIWPENTGVLVVRVDAAETGIVPNMTINKKLNTTDEHKQSGENLDAELDVLYYTGDAAEYTFAPENVLNVTLASPILSETAMTYAGFSTDNVTRNADGTITLSLTEGKNIVRLTNSNGSVYQVIRAKKVSYTITNATREGEALQPGDVATIVLDGVAHPCNKLAGVYNMSANIQYTDSEGNTLTSKKNQYQFASNEAARTISVTIPEDWNAARSFVINGGVLMASGYGDPYGGHREITYEVGKNPNFTAVQHTAYFGALPDIMVYEAVRPDYDLAILTFEDADYKGSGNVVSDDLTRGWSTLIDNQQYGGDLLYGDMASSYIWYDENNTGLSGGINLGGEYGDAFWSGGTAISNYVMNDYNGAGYTTQLSVYNPTEGGKGGHNNSDNFLVCYGYDDGSPYGRDNRPIITLADGAAVIDHAYVNLNAYGLNSAFNGDGFNTTGAGENDWVDLVAEALDAEGNPTGKTVTFRAIDGKANILQTWQKWELSELGECSAVRFNVTSSMAGDYGMNFPAYFLLDDIAVRVAKKTEADPDVATFEELALEPESYWAGDDNGEEWYYGLGYVQSFKSGVYSFENYYMEDYDYWMGYGYSNRTSTQYNGLTDQYNSCVGNGVNGSANYLVAYPDGSMWGETPSIHVEGEPRVVPGFYITNTAWVVDAIINGDGMSDGTFTAGDYFKITIHALDAEGNETATRDFCLADYRFESEADRYYIKNWTYVDLSQLGEAASFYFTFDGSRKNAYGLLTPTYFCIDDFGAEGEEVVREEGTYEGIGTSITDVKGESDPEVFSLDGIRMGNAARPGLYIINGRKVVVK